MTVRHMSDILKCDDNHVNIIKLELTSEMTREVLDPTNLCLLIEPL